jgi:hypothetical protein
MVALRPSTPRPSTSSGRFAQDDTFRKRAFAQDDTVVCGRLKFVRHRNRASTIRWHALLRKEVIQPHLPIRLPCYDFVPLT